MVIIKKIKSDKRTRGKDKNTRNFLNEDRWLYHMYHLQNGIKYEKRCKICNLKDNKETRKEPHARK